MFEFSLLKEDGHLRLGSAWEPCSSGFQDSLTVAITLPALSRYQATAETR